MGSPRNPRDRIDAKLTKCVGELNRLEQVIANAQSERDKLEAERAALAQSLADFDPKKLKVSDHAAVRYLERTKGLDRAALDAEIVTDELQNLVDKLGGTGRFPLKDSGFGVVLKDYTIVTVINLGGQ